MDQVGQRLLELVLRDGGRGDQLEVSGREVAEAEVAVAVDLCGEESPVGYAAEDDFGFEHDVGVGGQVAGLGLEMAGEDCGGDDLELERGFGRGGRRGGHVDGDVVADVAGLAQAELHRDGSGRGCGREWVGGEGLGRGLRVDAAEVEGEAALGVGDGGHVAVGRGDQHARDRLAVERADDHGVEAVPERGLIHVVAGGGVDRLGLRILLAARILRVQRDAGHGEKRELERCAEDRRGDLHPCSFLRRG